MVTFESNDVILIVDDSRFIAHADSRAVALGARFSRPLVRITSGHRQVLS